MWKVTSLWWLIINKQRGYGMKIQRQHIIALALLGLIHPVYAELTDLAVIRLQGRVVAAPCVVEQQSVNVSLGDNIKMSDLVVAGSFTPWVAFDIRVYNCPLNTAYSTITFSGTADESNPDFRYQNNGTATGVAIELLAQDGTPLGNGKSMVGSIANQEFTWNLRTRAFTETGSVKPGTVSTVISATLTYQ